MKLSKPSFYFLNCSKLELGALVLVFTEGVGKLTMKWTREGPLLVHARHQWGGGQDQEHVTDCHLRGSIKGDIVQVSKVHSSFANTGYPLQVGWNNVTGGWILASLAR